MASAPGFLSGTTLGRYRILEVLGRGGMGEVYRAEDMILGRQVAIKVLPPTLTGDPARLARFQQEARSASALNHPHLVSIYEIGEAVPDGGTGPVHFISMELVDGVTLREVITRGRDDLRRTIDYLAQAADALGAAHAAGIIHRDLKPENLMIAQGGYAKVLDFGLAKLRHETPLTTAAANDPTVTRFAQDRPGAEQPLSTAPGVVMGTVGYMSPEQARGDAIDHRSDVFSLGCVLYEGATRTRPFSGTSAVDTLHKIIHEQPVPLAQVASGAPPELQRIIRKCLAKNPDDRYQSMRDLALDLRDLRREMDSGPSAAIVIPERTSRSARAWPWIAAALALVSLLAVSGWLWTSSASREAEGALGMERLTSSGIVIDAVISGDGQYTAYVESQGGEQTLWLRQTRGNRALQLASTRGGFWGIAFSKDAASIYYAIKSATEPVGTLYAIPTLGGVARPVLTGIDSHVTFSPDGTRLAYYRVDPDGKGASSLMVADSNGENGRPLITKQPPEFFAPGFFVAPSWSPDGQRIAVTIRNSESRTARLALIDTQSAAEQGFESRYADATYTTWLPDGSGIVFSARATGMVTSGNGGQLWVQPYPSGEPRRITSDMLEYRTASITANGESLVTVTFDAVARLSLLPLGGGEERRLSNERAAGPAGISWAADGRRILYSKVVRSDLQIWSANADGTDDREVITKVRPSGVAVSRDGQWIVYGAERDGFSGVWRSRPDGSQPQQVFAVSDPTWLATSPVGSWVYFTSSKDGAPSTYRVPLEGGEARLVAHGFERAMPSPDGRLLAGLYKPLPGAALAIGILGAEDGRPVHVIPNYAPASGSGGFDWLPDGRTILYTTSERSNLWKQPITGEPPEKITNFSDLTIVRFALSPDGQTLLLCRGTALRDAVLLSNFR